MKILNEYNNNENNRTKSDIEKYGLSVILIEATDYLPSFAYSIGLLQSYNHPEIICFGLPIKTLHEILNVVADIIKSGQKIETNYKFDNIIDNYDTQFLKVDKSNICDYFGFAIEYYNSTDFSAFQLVWTDKNNRFPWETEFNEDYIYKQPLLDRNANFKFRENENLAIFTTKQWIENNKPILKVVHDNDGDWQFLTGDQMPEDIRIVALSKIIFKDKTINEVFNLDYGESAEREFIGGKWNRKLVEVDDEEK